MKRGGHSSILPPFLLLLPALFFFSVFTVWPLIEVVRLSFVRTNFITTVYVGLDNFIETFRAADFRQSILNSGVYIALLVPSITLTSLFMALFAHRISKRWQDASRIILYIPSLCAGIIMTGMWKWVFNDKGPINWILGLLHFPTFSWFAQGATAIPAIVFIVAFSSIGGSFIILLSAILGIDKSIFEAAKIDGARQGQIDTRIIIPNIAHTIALVAFLSFIQAPSIFENIYMLAPQSYAATMAYHIYVQGFQYGKYGLASAQSVIMLVIMLAVSLVKQKVAK